MTSQPPPLIYNVPPVGNYANQNHFIQRKPKGDMSITILENCRISPPPNTVGERSLELTFFDIMWLQFFPVNQLFFYNFSHPRAYFIEKIIPNLKHSLSVTLQHFFPFASNLILYPKPDNSSVARKPEIRHVEGDSIALTFAECDLDFHDLVGNHPRACDKFYPLVPRLGHARKMSDHELVPLICVQVTLFPNSGISIGITNYHTLCDASSKIDFLKAWSSIAKHGSDELFLASGCFPFYDRAIIYPDSLDEIYLNQWIGSIDENYQSSHPFSSKDKVRATLVFTRTHINRLKKFVSIQKPTLDYISTFSVVCA